jgi:hypothetical protein
MLDAILLVAALASVALSAAAILIDRWAGQGGTQPPPRYRRRAVAAPIDVRRPLKSRIRNAKVTLFSS